MDPTTASNALRALLTEAAKVPRLEAENAHLRKRAGVEPAANERAELDTIQTALRVATARLDSAWHDLMAIGAAADAFHRDVGAEPGSLTPAQIIAAAAQHYLDAEHLRSESNAIAAALAESPVPTCPPDCDLAGWIRYAVRGWMAERAEGNHLADLCQKAHDALTAAGVPPDGTPAGRIRLLAAFADIYSEIAKVEPNLTGSAVDRVRHVCAQLAQLRGQEAAIREYVGISSDMDFARAIYTLHNHYMTLRRSHPDASRWRVEATIEAALESGGQDLAGSGDKDRP